jgi:DNA invertase Pin-like site-specific DNA recombinase
LSGNKDHHQNDGFLFLYTCFLVTFISDLVFKVLLFGAEKARVDINRRQREGIDSAKQYPVIF